MSARLSALDATFFDVETPTSPLTVGVVATFDGGGLVGAHGELDLARLRAAIESAIGAFPRYRQRVIRVPGIGQPVWTDDAGFDLTAHVRLARVPHPGDDAQLRTLAADLFATPLDRTRPLWELWFVEGLAGGRFAMVGKVHHAMVDGLAGAGLLAGLLRPTPDGGLGVPRPWVPAPPPTPWQLVRDEVRHHNQRALALGGRMLAAVRGLRGGAGEAALAAADRLRPALRGAAGTLRTGLVPAPSTRLNPKQIGSRRAFATVRVELAAAKQVKTALGGTINDVALAMVAGGLGRYLARQGAAPPSLRALVPVSTRAGQSGGNQVALALVELPLAEADARARFAAIAAASRARKAAPDQVAAAAFFEEVADAVATRLVSQVVRLAVRIPAFNLVVTNVPGPPVPMYLLGARLLDLYPQVPLYETQGLGVALLSYAGGFYVGVSACPTTVPDVDLVAADLAAAFEELEAAAAA